MDGKMENKRILVVGGTGFIGSELVKQLINKKYDVTSFSRGATLLDRTYIFGDVLNKKDLLKKVKDFDIIIYLSDVIRTKNKEEYNNNIKGIVNMMKVMKRNKIDKIIYFSSQIVHKQNLGYYGRSKKECEVFVKKARNNHIIIRPNYVYNVSKHNDFFKLYNIMNKYKVCPVVGNGQNILQPVERKVLCEKVISIMEQWKIKEADISGNKSFTLNQVVKMMNDKYITVHIPLWCLKIFKRFIEFDIDGYNENMIAKGRLYRLDCNFEYDIKQIGKLITKFK